MRRVEKALSRLDGVIRVKAGWRSDKASILAEEGASIDLQKIDEALRPEGYRALKLVRER